jgi:hypothetical protein
MAVPNDGILPGILTPQGAAALQLGLLQAEDTKRELEAWLESAPWEFPAKITSFDQATGRCTWALQDYNDVGRRIDSVLGVVGTLTNMPAYPVGNGVMPPVLGTGASGSGSGFPIEVWMRHRIDTDTLGPVFEFDWQCACDGGYSGSGGV